MKSKHCDDLIDDLDQPAALREYLRWSRAPAGERFISRGKVCPALYATLKAEVIGHVWNGARDAKLEPIMHPVTLPVGTRIQVVMASRMGDVGITTDLVQKFGGYIARIYVLDFLENFGELP